MTNAGSYLLIIFRNKDQISGYGPQRMILSCVLHPPLISTQCAFLRLPITLWICCPRSKRRWLHCSHHRLSLLRLPHQNRKACWGCPPLRPCSHRRSVARQQSGFEPKIERSCKRRAPWRGFPLSSNSTGRSAVEGLSLMVTKLTCWKRLDNWPKYKMTST